MMLWILLLTVKTYRWWLIVLHHINRVFKLRLKFCLKFCGFKKLFHVYWLRRAFYRLYHWSFRRSSRCWCSSVCFLWRRCYWYAWITRLVSCFQHMLKTLYILNRMSGQPNVSTFDIFLCFAADGIWDLRWSNPQLTFFTLFLSDWFCLATLAGWGGRTG